MKKPWLLTGLFFFAISRICIAEDLLTIYNQALEADPLTRSSEIKIKVGSDQKNQALGEMLPQINGSMNWSANKQTLGGGPSNGFSGNRYTISVNQTLLDFAKFWNWRRAQSVESQYALENVQAQQELMAKVVEKYFDVLEAEDEYELNKSEAELTEQELQQIKKEFEKQLVKITDVYAIEARLDQIKASIIEAEAKIITAKESLKELTNTNFTALAKLRDDVEYKNLEGKLADWLEVAKSENPSLAAQQHAIAAAENDVTTQQSRHLPVVELQLNYFNTNTGFQSAQTNQTDTQVAAINVNVPIFSGGITDSRVQEAKHKLIINKYDTDARLRELIKETTDTFTNTNASVRRIKATQKALESATKSRDAREVGFDYGVETISDVLKAQQDEYVVLRELSKARYGYIKNRMRFMQAIGMISEENLSEVNVWLKSSSSSKEKIAAEKLPAHLNQSDQLKKPSLAVLKK